MTVKKIRLGILGGGQLGRMSAMAASQLGIETHIYCPEEHCPASLVTDKFTQATYENLNALKRFSEQVDVISYEFENIPLETVEFLQKSKPVYPDAKLLSVSQNRLKEKEFLNQIGIHTAPWAAAYKAEDIASTLKLWNVDKCIIKTARFGYDAKGQIKHAVEQDILENWNKLQTEEAIIEGIVDFSYEASILVARDRFGQTETFPVTINEHKNHILHKSAPARDIPPAIANQAEAIARKIAEAVNLTGLLAIELFITGNGEILANEIAPRTHNSGHWTMDGCSISQFEQHIRAVCGLPILKPEITADVEMLNLIGDDIDSLPDYFKMANARIHLYGKMEARPGRKMGHVNFLKLNGKDHDNR